MAVESIFKAMEVLRVKFKSHYEQWIHLKSESEFYFDVSHFSPIRTLYAEGVDCVRNLGSALETRYVGESMLLDEYIDRLHDAIPKKNLYNSIEVEARADFESNYKNNYTVQYMLRQYVEQWQEVQRVKQFLAQLESSSDYRLLRNTTPMDVIQRYAREWEQDVQLHEKPGETGLRSQLVWELKRSGFLATSETHAHDGHADIVVSRANSHGAEAGNILVAECKIWDGPAALYAAMSQLCQYTTPHDDHAALVVFVRTGDFADVCITASKELDKHVACSERRGESSLVEFTLTLPQDKQRQIPASLLLCNLTQPRLSRSNKVSISTQPPLAEVLGLDTADAPAENFVLSDSLRGKFGYGPCKCHRCKQSGGNQRDYEFKHTFEFNDSNVHRLFTSTLGMDDEAIIALLKSAEPSKGD